MTAGTLGGPRRASRAMEMVVQVALQPAQLHPAPREPEHLGHCGSASVELPGSARPLLETEAEEEEEEAGIRA